MDVQTQYEFTAKVDAVMAMFGDPEYQRQKLIDAGHTNIEVPECGLADDGSLRIVSRRTVAVDVPGALKRILKPTNTVTQTDVWQPGKRGPRSGTWTVEIKGIPIHLSGTMQLGCEGARERRNNRRRPQGVGTARGWKAREACAQQLPRIDRAGAGFQRALACGTGVTPAPADDAEGGRVGGPVVSVRGEARRTVAPDAVHLQGAVTESGHSKAEALRSAAEAVERLTAALRPLGGQALTVDTERAPLTWSMQSTGTHPEGEPNPQSGKWELTGRITSVVSLGLAVRDFSLLDAVAEALAPQQAVAIHNTFWSVDDDNPAWPDVRAAAIHSAIRKGRDYASALGGTLLDVLHVADAGLLGSDNGAAYRTSGVRMAAATSAGGPESGVPALDPVPQELVATIEARFSLAGVELADL